MPDPTAYSIADAKAQFADLVNQAQEGLPVRITRRGKPVAVLLSETEYERLQSARGGWVAFSKAWRRDMDRQGLDYLSDSELQGLRDRIERTAPELG